MNALNQLIEHGQSYWLDDLTRSMLDNGELERRVKEEGLRGITSNPKTFSDSLLENEAYRTDIRRMASEGFDDEGIHEAMMVDDVTHACDVLRPVYDESDGIDGFVSIEVDPRLARQTEPTIQAARRIFAAVDRPNCFIKIPGTEEGLPAIETCLADGINVNITLLFCLGRYKQVVAAYQRALDARRKSGQPPGEVASVASFFLSRIDVLVDELLSHRISPRSDESNLSRLRGQTAVAMARQVYAEFGKSFDGSAWNSLAADGARVQRPLWASTSTKTPDLPDTYYVDSLVAADTVNTLPAKTIDAFRDHGTAKADAIRALAGTPEALLNDLAAAGIELGYVSQRLEDEGIQKFIDPYEEAIAHIRKVRSESEVGASA